MIKSPPNLTALAKKTGLSEETVSDLLSGSQVLIKLLIKYIETHHKDAVFKNKISALRLESLNYAASQAYSNGQIKQTKNILKFLNTLTKEN